MENTKKFLGVEIFLLMMFAVLSDAIGIVLVAFGVDDFFLLDVLNLLPIGWLMLMKSMPLREARAFLVGCGLEILPYVGALPLLTVAMFINIRRYNHPESAIAKVAEKAAGAAGIKRGVKGGRVGLEGRAPEIKSPVGTIPAPQVVLAKAPTEKFAKIQ